MDGLLVAAAILLIGQLVHLAIRDVEKAIRDFTERIGE